MRRPDEARHGRDYGSLHRHFVRAGARVSSRSTRESKCGLLRRRQSNRGVSYLTAGQGSSRTSDHSRRSGNLGGMDEALKAEHEAGLALFLEPSSRGRFRHALTSARARSKFRAKLAHFAHLDQRFATKVSDKSLVAARLHELGAPRVCYVMSEDSEIDGASSLLMMRSVLPLRPTLGA